MARYNKLKKINKGFGLLEIVVGAGIILILLFGVSSISEMSLRTETESIKNTKAAFLLEEGAEAIKMMRDESYASKISALTSSTNYYLSFENESWSATSSNIYIGGVFERKFVLENTLRDTNDDISSSGVVDPNTKKFTVFVSWQSKNGTTTKKISGIIANIFDN